MGYSLPDPSNKENNHKILRFFKGVPSIGTPFFYLCIVNNKRRKDGSKTEKTDGSTHSH